MNDVVDTVGWDVAIGVPLAMANARLQAQQQRLIRSLSLTLASDRTYRVAGEIASWRIVEGQGVICRVELTFGISSVFSSSPAPSANGSGTTAPGDPAAPGGIEHDIGGVTLRLGLAWDIRAPAGCGDADPGADLAWRGDDAAAADDAPEDSFSVAVLAPAELSLPREIKDLLKGVCAAGLRECRAAICASLARVLCAGVVRRGQAVQPGRVAYLVASGGDASALVMLLTFAGQEQCAALQPVIPAALPMHGCKPSVALSSALLPSADPARMILEMLAVAQRPGLAQFGLLPTAGPAAMPPMPSPGSFDVDTHPGAAGFDLTLKNDVYLDVYKDDDHWHVTLGKFTCSLRGSELTLDYFCFPYYVQTPKRHAVQRFALDVVTPDGACPPGIALRGRFLSETLNDDSGNFFSGLLSLAAPWLSVSERIKASFDYLPVDLHLSLFGDGPLYPESGYMHGGMVFTAPEPAPGGAVSP